MKRSAFITSSGDVFTLLNCLSYYESVWKSEVDELWIALNSTMERDVMTTLIGRFPKNVKFIYLNQRLGYGKPLNLLLECSPEGNVLLLEDDSIIFKKGIVTKYFDMLETGEYDIIGSPRMSCTKEVADKLQKEFDLNYEGWGDRGPNWWPCFLWTKKELLLKTDRNFDPTDWGDCFVWMSVQLRRLIKDQSRIKEIPQYHCSPDDFKNKEQGLGIFDGECGYMHLGSLSSGIESYLLDENQIPLSDREAGIRVENPKPIENTPEMQRRLMWWRHCSRRSYGKDERLGKFNILYSYAVNRARDEAGISPLSEDLDKWEELYRGVING